MNNKQIDEILLALDDYDDSKILEFVNDEELKSQILNGGGLDKFELEVCQNLMCQIQEEGYDYFYSKLYGHPEYHVLLRGLTDPSKIMQCVEDDEMAINDYYKGNMIVSLHDVEYFDKYIRKIHASSYIVDLIIEFGDVGYMEKCCEDTSFRFSETDVTRLLEATGDSDYIKRYIDNNFSRLSDEDMVNLLIATGDVEYMKFFVFRFQPAEKVRLIKAINDTGYIEECIKDRAKLGLNPFYVSYLMNLVDDEKFVKECLFDAELKLSSTQIRDLILNKIKDKKYIEECAKDGRLNILDTSDICSILTKFFEDQYIIECIEGKHLDLADKTRNELLLYVHDDKYVCEVLLNNKFPINSLIKEKLIKSLFELGSVDDNFVKKFIENEELGIMSYSKIRLIELLDDACYTKECILNGKLGLSIGEKSRLIIQSDLDEKDIVECLKSETLNFSPDHIKSIIERIPDDSIRKGLVKDFAHKLPVRVKMEILLGCDDIGEYIEELPFLSMFRNEDANELSFLDKVVTEYKKINLPASMTIGMEIESVGEMSGYIEDFLSYKNWSAKKDMSIRDGIEVVSPILHGTDEESKQIFVVCNMLKSVGQTASNACGGHIHIGADYLQSKQAWANLFEMYCNTEKILYAITNKEGEVPRTKIMTFATPLTSKFQNAMDDGVVNFENETDLDEFIKELRNIQEIKHDDYLWEDSLCQYDRHFGMNLCNLGSNKNTIEFRFPNGTVEPELWVDNINLLGGMVAIANELSILQQSDELTNEQKIKLELFDELKTDISDKRKLVILTELIGLEPTGYIKRFESNIDMLLTNEELSNELSRNKPITVKSKPVITVSEIAKVAQGVLPSNEIDAMSQLSKDAKEKHIMSVQR